MCLKCAWGVSCIFTLTTLWLYKAPPQRLLPSRRTAVRPSYALSSDDEGAQGDDSDESARPGWSVGHCLSRVPQADLDQERANCFRSEIFH